jgi:PBP1b-binding outer membrane lipoprotein LpoB
LTLGKATVKIKLMKKIYFNLFLIFILSACSHVEENTTTKKNIPDFEIRPQPINTVSNHFSIETHREGSDERIMELNQNLSFYCMKGSRRVLFKSEKSCQDFVRTSLKNCEKNHRIVNRALISCVKNKLKIK